MWRILTIISSIALLGSAYVGLLNNNKLKDERQAIESAKATLAKTTDRLAKEKERLDKATQERDEKLALEQRQKTEKATLVAKNEGLTSEISTSTAKLTENKAKLDDAKAKLKDLPDLDALAESIQAMNKEDADLAQAVADSEAKLTAVGIRQKDLENMIQAAEKRESDIRNHLSPAELKAHLLTVHNALGFVIIDAGINKGIVGGSKLAVMRGSEKIGELMVSAVERTRTAADVVPGSVLESRSLMPGDSVIAIRTVSKPTPKKTTATTAPKSEPKDGTTAETEDQTTTETTGDSSSTGETPAADGAISTETESTTEPAPAAEESNS